MLQKITIIGNLGRDPEMRYTPAGKSVTNFSVATNRKWNDADGNPQEQVIWFKVAAWNRLAEVCNEYLKKGRQVYIEGRLTCDKETGNPRIFTRSDGTPGTSFEMTAGQVLFLGTRGDYVPVGPEDEASEPEVGDESIPF